MMSNDEGKSLHDKATRGEKLTAQERGQLEHWYATQDAAEARDLSVSTAEQTLNPLQEQVDAAFSQLLTITKRIQEIAAENDLLRREIVTLRQKLAHLLSPQST